MKKSPVFLTTAHILEIHARMIREFGGDPGVRDHGLLESAVAMPAATFGGKFLHEDIPAMAAAYLFHLSKNHPFLDGNKRTSLAAAEVFLLLNDMRLNAANKEIEVMAFGVADGRVSKEEAVLFFRKRTAKA